MALKEVASDFDLSTGMRETFYYDDDTGRVTVDKSQNVTGVIDQNRREFNQHRHKSGFEDGLYHCARIPLATIERWRIEGRIDWFNSTDNERRKVLNSPDCAAFRTRPGRV